jgi:polar amino acid transport system permease protein
MEVAAATGSGRWWRTSAAASRLVWAAETVVGTILFIFLLQFLFGFSIVDASLWEIYWPAFAMGIWGTVGYSAVIVPLSVVLGFTIGIARISRARVVAAPFAVFIDFFRGTPPLVLVIFAFLIGPSLLPARFQGRTLGLAVAVLALAFHSASYQAEIFRAGFQSVPRVQLEAAQALGMSPWQSMAHVVLPQALRLSLPPLGNELAVVIKDTSLLAIIGAIDLFGVSQDVQQNLLFTPGYDPRWFLIMWTAVALVYFVLTAGMTQFLLFLERRYHVRGIEAMSL